MRKIGGRKRLLSASAAVLAGVAGVAGAVLLASPAGAHTATLETSSTCDKTSGTYTVTYTGHSHDTDLGGTATVTDSTPSGTNVAPTDQQITATDPFTITQSGIPGTATSASINVRVVWTDDYTQTPSAQVTLGGDCAPPTQVTPTTPTFVDDTCAGAGSSYTIPSVDGVDYQVDGATVDAGVHSVDDGTSITITAVAQPDHVLTGTATWTHDFPAAPTPAECAGPAAPTFADDVCADTGVPAGASYTIPETDGVDYQIDGVTVDAGTHPVTDNTTITIMAVARDGHQLNGTTSWTHVFPAAPTDCAISGTAPAPTFADATCESTQASYTIPTAEGVQYLVDDQPVAAGKHTVDNGTSVTITAVGNVGHTIVGTASWTHDFPATVADCIAGGGGAIAGGPAAAPPGGTAALANTGPAVPVAQTTLLGVLLAMLGIGCLLAGRRPSAPGRHATAKA